MNLKVYLKSEVCKVNFIMWISKRLCVLCLLNSFWWIHWVNEESQKACFKKWISKSYVKTSLGCKLACQKCQLFSLSRGFRVKTYRYFCAQSMERINNFFPTVLEILTSELIKQWIILQYLKKNNVDPVEKSLI